VVVEKSPPTHLEVGKVGYPRCAEGFSGLADYLSFYRRVYDEAGKIIFAGDGDPRAKVLTDQHHVKVSWSEDRTAPVEVEIYPLTPEQAEVIGGFSSFEPQFAGSVSATSFRYFGTKEELTMARRVLEFPIDASAKS
jgi:hypothetical protein